MHLKEATIADIKIIEKLANDIWPIAYQNVISKAQIDYMLALMYSNKALEEQFANDHQFILAYNDMEYIGFASYSLNNINTPHIYKLNKLYALQNKGYKGIGSLLIANIEATIKTKNATQLLLNVNKNNSAKTFYLKKGFTFYNEEVINIGQGFVMDDYIMQKLL